MLANRNILFKIFVIFLSILVWRSWMYTAIHPDEIANLVHYSRAVTDNFYRLSPLQFCEGGSLVKIPGIFTAPAVLMASLSLVDSYKGLRYFTLCLFLVSFGLFIINFCADNFYRRRGFVLLAVMFGCAHVGVAAILRAELILVSCLCLAITIYFYSRNKSLSWQIFSGLLIYLLFLLGLYVHPKFFYLTPVFILIIISLSNKLRYWRILILFACLVPIFQIYPLHKSQFLECVGNPLIQLKLNSFNINPLIAFADPFDFIRQVVSRLAVVDYVKIIERGGAFRSGYDFGFIPDHAGANFSGLANFLWYSLIFYVFWCVLGGLYSVFKIVNSRDLWHSFDLKDAIFLSLVFAISASFLLNKVQAFYDIGYLISLLAIASIFSRASFSQTEFEHVAVGIALLLLLLTHYVIHSSIRPVQKSGHAEGAGGFSVSIVKDDNRRADMLRLGELCGLKDGDELISFDDESYLYLSGRKNLVSLSYSRWGLGDEGALRWYRKKNVSSIYARCTEFDGDVINPKKTNGLLHRVNNMCCLRLNGY
jgi:hypothetical protein